MSERLVVKDAAEAVAFVTRIFTDTKVDIDADTLWGGVFVGVHADGEMQQHVAQEDVTDAGGGIGDGHLFGLDRTRWRPLKVLAAIEGEHLAGDRWQG